MKDGKCSGAYFLSCPSVFTSIIMIRILFLSFDDCFGQVATLRCYLSPFCLSLFLSPSLTELLFWLWTTMISKKGVGRWCLSRIATNWLQSLNSRIVILPIVVMMVNIITESSEWLTPASCRPFLISRYLLLSQREKENVNMILDLRCYGNQQFWRRWRCWLNTTTVVIIRFEKKKRGILKNSRNESTTIIFRTISRNQNDEFSLTQKNHLKNDDLI